MVLLVILSFFFRNEIFLSKRASHYCPPELCPSSISPAKPEVSLSFFDSLPPCELPPFALTGLDFLASIPMLAFSSFLAYLILLAFYCRLPPDWLLPSTLWMLNSFTSSSVGILFTSLSMRCLRILSSIVDKFLRIVARRVSY